MSTTEKLLETNFKENFNKAFQEKILGGRPPLHFDLSFRDYNYTDLVVMYVAGLVTGANAVMDEVKKRKPHYDSTPEE